MTMTVTFWMGHPLSYTTTRIDSYFNDHMISSATGFVLSLAEKYYLVTNWHALSGINPIDGTNLSKMAAIPNRIKFHVALETSKVVKNVPRETIFFKPIDVWLFKRGAQIWFDRKASDNQNDFAAIPIDAFIPELKRPGRKLRAISGGKVTLKRGLPGQPTRMPLPATDINHFYPAVGSEVFVLGYPKGIIAGGIFPIWKRASIASEPQSSISLDGKDYQGAFFIDAMTKHGMSGSPVVFLGKKGNHLFSDDGVRVELNADEPLFVGVYAGRNGVTDDEHELSLGRVWKTEAVERMIFEDLVKAPAVKTK